MRSVQIEDMCIFQNKYNLYDMFDYYNQIVFNNVIDKIDLEWVQRIEHARGNCCYRCLDGSIKINLSIEALKSNNEYEVANVLVHEMIHALLFQLHVEMDISHGPMWNMIAFQANSYFGLNITEFGDLFDVELQLRKDEDQKQRVQNSFMGHGRML